MTDDPRLLLHLESLRLTLATYLGRLQRLWDGAPPVTEVTEVERLLVSAGTLASPDVGERQTLDQLRNAAQGAGGTLANISSALGLSPEDELLVAAAWWADTDPQFATVLGCAHDDGARRYASAGLLRLLFGPFEVRLPAALPDDGLLVRHGVLAAGADNAGPLRLTPTARLVLADGEPPAFEPPEPLPARLKGERAALSRHLSSGGRGPMIVCGPRGAGRRALAAESAVAAGLRPVRGDRPAAELHLLGSLGLAVPVMPVERLEELAWEEDGPPLLAWGSGDSRPAGAYVVVVPPPDRKQRASIWARALDAAGVAETLAPLLASRFRFTEGDIAEVLRRAGTDAMLADSPVDGGLVWEAARRQPEHALSKLAELITPAFELGDLILDERAREQIEELVSHVALQHVVLDEWGFRRRLPRGQGVAALFTGPPGTGKTMTAEAVADALRQDLYRIDLSSVVSKYVGETEKNLASAFDEAERAGAVLFFDEADALFSQRTEVRDSHDRYANLLVNYLLQRVETFSGLVLLASNRQAALDEAFMRRLRFSIRFDLPGEDLRRALWRRSFPPGVATDDLDWDALAQYELTGGSIQNAALAAAYLAASEDGPIDMPRVRRALAREHEKLGRAWPGALVAEAVA